MKKQSKQANPTPGKAPTEGLRKWRPLIILALVLAGVLLALWRVGVFDAIKSVDDLRAFIENFSPYAHIVFFLIQLASVIVAPIPSNITTTAGALAFGLWPGFLLSAGAMLLGSVIVFVLAQRLGKPFADRLVESKVSDKYLSLIEKKRDTFLVLVFLMPFFPDDLICILAGLTGISLPRFFIIALLTRPWGLLFAALVGSATITVPVWAWPIIAIAFAGVFVLGMKYGDKIEERLLGKMGK